MKMLLPICFLATLAAADSPQSLLTNGRADAAIAALTSQIQSEPNNAGAHNLLCRAYYSLGQWDEAILSCEKAVALEPSQSRYHLWLGRAYGEKADHSSFLTAGGFAKKLRVEFERAVAIDPTSVETRCDLAEFYIEAPGVMGGGHDKARAQAEALKSLDPAKSHWVLARVAEKENDAATAEREYRAELDASHGSADAWLDLAYFYKRANRLDDMENAIKKVGTSPVVRQDVLLDAAETLFRAQRNLALAADLVRRYLAGSMTEEAPAFKAHTLLGNLLEKQGDKAGAEREYRAALALAKDYKPAQEALKKLGK